MQLGIVLEKNWALSVDQCLLEALQFLVPYIYLLIIVIRCNSLARIQKAVVDHTGRRAPNSDHDLFSVQVWEVLWSFLVQPLSWSLAVVYDPLFVAGHNPLEKWFIAA